MQYRQQKIDQEHQQQCVASFQPCEQLLTFLYHQKSRLEHHNPPDNEPLPHVLQTKKKFSVI